MNKGIENIIQHRLAIASGFLCPSVGVVSERVFELVSHCTLLSHIQKCCSHLLP